MPLAIIDRRLTLVDEPGARAHRVASEDARARLAGRTLGRDRSQRRSRFRRPGATVLAGQVPPRLLPRPAGTGYPGGVPRPAAPAEVIAGMTTTFTTA